MEGSTDRPQDSVHQASETQNATDAIDACAKALEIVGNHLAARLLNKLDKREPFSKLYVDLYICHNFRQEEQARLLLPRMRGEIKALLTCPVASQPDAIEGILLRRFFGMDGSRSYLHESYKRPASTLGAAQPVADAASNRVINISELLEAILSHLPSRSLVRSSGVSKTFRNLTRSSPTLQKNLFMLAKKEPLETISLACQGEGDSGESGEQTKEYRIPTLCPLLHMDSQSHLTVKQRFESEDCEVAKINPRAVHANSSTQMFLTNPPCVDVDVKLVYKGTAAPGTSFPVNEVRPATHYTITAIRKTRNDAGVTFAMLMEVAHMKGLIWITAEDRDGEIGDDKGTLEDSISRFEVFVVDDMTLHEQIKAWEEKCSRTMCLDLAATEVMLHGVVVRTAADFAAVEKADREAKMEEEQRKIFRAVLLKHKQKMNG